MWLATGSSLSTGFPRGIFRDGARCLGPGIMNLEFKVWNLELNLESKTFKPKI